MRMTLIRKEHEADRTAIREINQAAFDSREEADVVDALREQCDEYFALVAVCEEEIVGHIVFTPATLRPSDDANVADDRQRTAGAHGNDPGDGAGGGADGRRAEIKGMGLAPMAVLPQYQRQGFGGRLVEKGVALLAEAGCPFVVVLGHPEYYPRFGFERASTYGVRCDFAHVPDEAFMIKVLHRRLHDAAPGVVSYRPEFTAVSRE
jgi:putative acetyltransferase